MKRFLAIYLGSMSGDNVKKWNSMDDEPAAKQFLNHPHFSIFPGEAVEIMECLPMPAM